MTSASSSSRTGSAACCNMRRQKETCAETMERVDRRPGEELSTGSRSTSEIAAAREQDRPPPQWPHTEDLGKGSPRRGRPRPGRARADGGRAERSSCGGGGGRWRCLSATGGGWPPRR
jgi:hypothetical protein